MRVGGKKEKVFVFHNHSFQKHLPEFRVKRVNCNYLEQEQHDVYKNSIHQKYQPPKALSRGGGGQFSLKN